MIDFSHANSSKKYERQIDVGRDVAQQIAGRDRGITGVMIESHLEPGRQDLLPGQTKADLRPGVSITDACLGWSQTEPLLRELAAAVALRRAVDPSTGTPTGAAQAAPRALAQPLIASASPARRGPLRVQAPQSTSGACSSRPALMSAVIPLLVATGLSLAGTAARAVDLTLEVEGWTSMPSASPA